MKKVVAFLAAAAMVVSMASMVFAEEGTIKSVDEKAGTVVFCPKGGEDQTLKADKSVNLSEIKAGANVDVSIENNTVMSVKEAKRRRAAVGC